jgi:molybdate transport system ATP-binding protein
LDEPFLGLDAAGRNDVAILLGSVVRDGLRLVLITRPEMIPDWVTHVLKMDRLRAAWQGRRDELSFSVTGLTEASYRSDHRTTPRQRRLRRPADPSQRHVDRPHR